MNHLDVPIFTVMLSVREMAAVTSAVKIVLHNLDLDSVRAVLGDAADEAVASLASVDARLERMLNARKSGRK